MKTIRKNIQMEKWGDTVLDIRAAVDKLGCKCGQLPRMHTLSDCDTVSYPYGKGKKAALKVLVNNDIDHLQHAIGEPDISRGQLKDNAGAFFLYGQHNTDSLNTARYKMYMSRKKPPPLKKAATDRQQPATTNAPNPSPNDTMEGSTSEASTSRCS